MSGHESKIKNYHEAVAFLESLSNLSSSSGRTPKIAGQNLKKVQAFLKFIGNPQDKLKIIHIAGTSGKGSVAEMLHEIFLADGVNVGSYTSPHTTTFIERIKVGKKYISPEEMVRLVNFLKEKMDEFVCGKNGGHLSFFEASFCLAIIYFARKKCKYAVIETGCGGRYDATNAIQKPAFTIITNIGPDHLDTIGPTLKDVAYEKAGIIKCGAPFLTGERRNNLLKIFVREAVLKSSKFKVQSSKIRNIKASLSGTSFEYGGEDYRLRLLGAHQAENATLAIECAKDLGIGAAVIKSGLLKTVYSARMEIMSKGPLIKGPLIIVDGAHNEDKLRATIDFIKFNHPKGRRYLIIAAAKNKKIKKIIPMLKTHFDEVHATRFSNPFRRVLDSGDWQRGFANKKVLYYHYPHDALGAVLTKLRKYDLLLITGSIFLAGELREHWYSEEYILKNRQSK